MIINRKMKKAYLQEKKKIRTQSGATKVDWDKDNQKNIKVAIFSSSHEAKFISDGIKFAECTHIGLTKEVGVGISKFRIIQDDITYLVKDSKKSGRFTLLILKEDNTNV
ncbi:hypothetical protein FDA77_00875 [Clostridium botulinum]|nr:hypothetical protein [Clostridium botulinum]HDI3121683.1 hypothetical protein [Clostridium botulinum]